MCRQRELVVEVGAATLLIRLKTFREGAISEAIAEQLIGLLLAEVTIATGCIPTIGESFGNFEVRDSHQAIRGLRATNLTEQWRKK